MYITGQHRYDNYTSRYDVYLFTLRDYTEVLLDKFSGRYLERSDMPIHSGYLLEFVNFDKAKEFITNISESKTEDGKITTYVLPHLEGNELPLYATTYEGLNIVYIGLSEFKDALNEYVTDEEEEEPSIELDKETATVAVGADVTLVATTVPEDAEVTWSASDDGAYATVENGVVTGVAKGEATITAKITVDEVDYTATCVVTVTAE